MTDTDAALNWQVVTGIVFAAVLVVFFMIVWFVRPKNPSGDNILRILASVLAGAAGAFLSGGITVEAQGQISPAFNIGVSAAGGGALFFLVWVGWKQTLGSGFNLSLPATTTFETAARTIAQAAGKSCRFSGFTPEALAAESTTDIRLQQPSPAEALRVLWQFYPDNQLPGYDVTESETGWRVTGRPG